MPDQLFLGGKQFVDCSQGEEGITLQMLVDMLRTSELDLPIRFDEVLISPTVVSGRLCLKLEVTDQVRHASEDEVIMLTSI